MKTWFNNALRGKIALVTAGSLCITPISNISADQVYYSDASMYNSECCPGPCSPCNPCWNSRDSWLLVGSLLVGAAAGAAAGAATSHGKHGKRGCQGDPGIGELGPTGATGATGATGPTGPTGPAGITNPSSLLSLSNSGVEDSAYALYFHYNAGVTVLTGTGSVTVTTFVADPNGAVVQGAPTTITGPGTIAAGTLPTISVGPTNLLLGRYTAGLIIDNPASNVLNITDLGIAIYSTRPPADTTLIHEVGPQGLLSDGSIQTSGEFIYGSE